MLKYSEVCEKYDDFNIVLAFATHLPDVLERIKAMNAEHPVFAPDIPVAGNGLFTGKYFDEHKAEFQTVYDNLADDESRRVYENVLKFKISGKLITFTSVMNMIKAKYTPIFFGSAAMKR